MDVDLHPRISRHQVFRGAEMGSHEHAAVCGDMQYDWGHQCELYARGGG